MMIGPSGLVVSQRGEQTVIDLQKQIILTGQQGQGLSCTEWAIINHPDPEKTDYLCLNDQGYTFYEGPTHPMKNGAWARIPMKPHTLTLPDACRLLAGWFEEHEHPISGVPGYARCRKAHVTIYRHKPGCQEVIELTEDAVLIYNALGDHNGHTYSAGNIATVLHRWFGKAGK